MVPRGVWFIVLLATGAMSVSSVESVGQEYVDREARIIAFEGEAPQGISGPFGSLLAHGVALNNAWEVAFSDGMEIYKYNPLSEQVVELLHTGDDAPDEPVGATHTNCPAYPCRSWAEPGGQECCGCACIQCLGTCFGQTSVGGQEDCGNPLPADFEVTGMSSAGVVLFEADVLRSCPAGDCGADFQSGGVFTRNGAGEMTTLFLCGPSSCDGGAIFYARDRAPQLIGDQPGPPARMGPSGFSLSSAKVLNGCDNCSFSNHRTLFRTGPEQGACGVIARTGGPAPGGGTFTVPYAYELPTFFAFSRHPGVDEAAFVGCAGDDKLYRLIFRQETDTPEMTLIANSGDNAPGTAQGVTFDFETSKGCDIGKLGEIGPDVAFTADLDPLLDPFEDGIFTWDYQNPVVQCLFVNTQSHPSLGGYLRSPWNPIINANKVFGRDKTFGKVSGGG